jgi:hypothetical protein
MLGVRGREDRVEGRVDNERGSGHAGELAAAMQTRLIGEGMGNERVVVPCVGADALLQLAELVGVTGTPPTPG